ncbi:MAG: AtpZ/AtpI family protein [Pirellulaceae bacterium]
MANGKETGQNERDQTKSANSWMRFAGMGLELASYTLALTAIGYAVDHYRGHQTPIATAIGTMIGFSFGMFRFIQRASNASEN